MNFHEVQFPAPLSFGSSGGPERRTEIVTLSNGFEERNAPWAHSRRRFDAGLGVRSLDDLAEVMAFFEAREGQLYGFRWKDWSDFKSCQPSAAPSAADQRLGVGDGARREFTLEKVYGSDASQYRRPIKKPINGTVMVAIEGNELAYGADFLLDDRIGAIVLSKAAPAGKIVSAGFEFDVPVRFDTDRIAVSISGFSAGEIPSVPVVEVRV